MADFSVFLSPRPNAENGEHVEVLDAELNFNQMGWLVFTDRHREAVATFHPGAVSHVLRHEAESDIEFVETLPDPIIVVN